MTFTKLLWIALRTSFLAALVACSASSRAYRTPEPPAAESMPAALAIGSWESTFGKLAIEPDASRGGLAAGAVRGSWAYARDRETFTGDFTGSLRGTLLEVRWIEAGRSSMLPLVGKAFVTFDATGNNFTGMWWTDAHDRMGMWQGWRRTP